MPDPTAETGLEADAISARYPAGTTARTTVNLNLRASNSTSARVLRVMPAGSTVTMVDGVPSAGWYRVEYSGTTGWASGNRLELIAGGGGGGGGAGGGGMRPLAANSTWHVDIEPPINPAIDAEVFDVDLFGSTAEVISDLHTRGKRVICYFSAGTYENWRPDAASYPESVLGNPMDEWPGERWVDIRSNALSTVLLQRLDMARAKGCDGVDPDNVDAWDGNNPGFALSAANELDFLRFLSNAAHSRGLLIGLKNNVNQVRTLVGDFDFAVNEECASPSIGECNLLSPFIAAGKPVFNIQYVKAGSFSSVTQIVNTVCDDANRWGFFSVAAPADRMNGMYTRCTDRRAVR